MNTSVFPSVFYCKAEQMRSRGIVQWIYFTACKNGAFIDLAWFCLLVNFLLAFNLWIELTKMLSLCCCKFVDCLVPVIIETLLNVHTKVILCVSLLDWSTYPDNLKNEKPSKLATGKLHYMHCHCWFICNSFDLSHISWTWLIIQASINKMVLVSQKI